MSRSCGVAACPAPAVGQLLFWRPCWHWGHNLRRFSWVCEEHRKSWAGSEADRATPCCVCGAVSAVRATALHFLVVPQFRTLCGAGEAMSLTTVRERVTCQGCLEWLHS